MKARMTIEIELSDKFIDYDDSEALSWAEYEILISKKDLIVHCYDVGDVIGKVTKLTNFVWLNNKN